MLRGGEDFCFTSVSWFLCCKVIKAWVLVAVWNESVTGDSSECWNAASLIDAWHQRYVSIISDIFISASAKRRVATSSSRRSIIYQTVSNLLLMLPAVN